MLATIAIAALFSGLSVAQAPESNAVYLSDRPDLLVHAQQAWGELGLDECAHAHGQKGLPLQIGEKKYARGLGAHASGQVIVDLGGQYDAFSAEIGVQPLPGGTGTVVFKVFVDDQLKFESPILRTGEPARSISVPVSGASELRLEITDAGDGITCDCANWSDARLIPSASPKPVPAVARLDVAPFARVVTSDPARMNGCKAKRTEEYSADDIYLETDLHPDASGAYTVPFTKDGPGAIGLRWLERRVLKEVGLEFADAGAPKSTEGVQIQYWAGESAWQGQWLPIKAEIRADANRWRANLSWREAPELRKGTRRIRWIFPAAANGTVIRKLTAVSATPLAETQLQVECDPRALGDSAARMSPAEVVMYNGELVSPLGRGSPPAVRWNYRTGEPLSLTLRYARPRHWKTDATVLQFRLPGGGAFGVAVDDVIAQGQVYVKSFGIYVSRPGGPTLAEHRRQIAPRKTILEEVRHLPDQTLTQAIEHVHNPKQDLQPTMLSLACDNHKFILHRDGTIQFAADQSKPLDMDFGKPNTIATLRPAFGKGKAEGLKRHLEGGWLPFVVNEITEKGIVYRQRTCVVPLDQSPLPGPGWLAPHPVCVVEFEIENTKDERAPIALNLDVQLGDKDVQRGLRGVLAHSMAIAGGRVIACADTSLMPGPLSETFVGKTGFRFDGELSANQTATIVVYLPGWALTPEDHGQLTGGVDLFDRLMPYWKHVLAPAAQINVPDPLLMNVIKASQVHCLIAARNEDDGQRVAPWIASVSYGPLESEGNSIIRGMDYLGHHEFARRAHDFFIHRYSPAGFLTTGYTLMGTGWQVWTLGQHYQLTRDADWLKKIAPDVARVCKWIMAQREKTKQLGPDGQRQPEYGLMPPGVMADWNAYAYHFCLNAYYYAALQATATALADINYPDTKAWFENAADFKEDILRAYRWTQARMPAYPLRDGTAVPGYPSQVHSPGPLNNFFPGEDGNRSWCYDVELGAHHLVPLGVLDPASRDVTWMMDHHEDVQFISEGWFDYPAERNHSDWFNCGGFAKVQPYYCRSAEVYALRDDVKPFIRSYFNTIPSLLSLENLSFQEHFAGVAAWNKTHETGYFLHQTRLMMVMERDRDKEVWAPPLDQNKDKELWLAPFVTSKWMHDGQTVSIENAPTHFGPVSYRITSHVATGTIEATIQPPKRNPPEVLVLRLRHPDGKPMQSVTVNGADHRDFDPGREIVRIKSGSERVSVVGRY